MEKKKSPKHAARTNGPSADAQTHNNNGPSSSPRFRNNSGASIAPRSRVNDGPSADPQTGTNSPSINHEHPKNRLRVSGFPVYTQARELVYLFSELGSPRVEHMETRSAVLKFRSPEDANAALRAPRPMLYGQVLALSADVNQRRERPRRNREKNERPGKGPQNRNEDQEMELDPSKIDFSGDFHEQLATVLASVRLTQEEVAKMSELYADLEDVFHEYWPGCVTRPFGSITSGLGIKTSDADCFVDIPKHYRQGDDMFVRQAKRLLYRYPGTFRHVICIPRANTPIVKFFHVTTQTNCDVSFKTPLGVRNSQLIAFLLHVDPRLIPVAVLIKYWGKVGGFTGGGKLTNYALIMMLIFYLQQLNILPSVYWLQANAPRCDVDCWNTGFNQSYNNLPKTTCEASIPDLIGGFFDYYSKFNYQEDVVSPFLGRTMKKCEFNDLNSLPSEYSLYKSNVEANYVYPLRVTSPICVQDPFDQTHNVASVISERCAREVHAYFAFAAEAFEEAKKDNYESFLKKILLEKPIIPRKSLPEYRTAITERSLKLLGDADWQAVVREVTFKIFEHILKFELERVTEEESPKSTKTKKEKYVSVLNKTIWKRKQFTKIYNNMNLSFIEKQTRITEEIFNVDKSTLNIKFQLTLSFSLVKKNAVISIKVLDDNVQIFREFGQFFLSVSQYWHQQLLKPYQIESSNAKKQVNKTENKVKDDIQVKVQQVDEGATSSEDEDTADAVDNNVASANETDSSKDEGD